MAQRADKAKVEAIVRYLDTDGDGHITTAEIKPLISKLARVPIKLIEDDHPEVLAMSDMTAEHLVQQLWSKTDAAKINRFYTALGLDMGFGTVCSNSLMMATWGKQLFRTFKSKEQRLVRNDVFRNLVSTACGPIVAAELCENGEKALWSEVDIQSWLEQYFAIEGIDYAVFLEAMLKVMAENAECFGKSKDIYDPRWANAALEVHEEQEKHRYEQHGFRGTHVKPFSGICSFLFDDRPIHIRLDECYDQCFDENDSLLDGCLDGTIQGRVPLIQLTNDLLNRLRIQSSDSLWVEQLHGDRVWSKSAYKLWFMGLFVWPTDSKDDCDDIDFVKEDTIEEMSMNPMFEVAASIDSNLSNSSNAAPAAEEGRQYPVGPLPFGEAAQLSELKEEDRKLFQKKFMQYDLDDSGHIEFHEMQQLILSLTVALQIQRGGFDHVIQQRDEISEDASWTLEEFSQWFLTSFEFCDGRASGTHLVITGRKLQEK